MNIEILGTGLGAVAAAVTIASFMLRHMDRRLEERMKLCMSNGCGEIIKATVRLSVLEALQEHAGNCPHEARIDQLEGQVPARRRA